MLNEQHLYVDDASRIFLPDYKRDPLLRFSISQVDTNTIKRGIEQLAQCITLIDDRNDDRKNHPIPNNLFPL
jgi:DNA-binding transcriptional MocR family regulator